MIAFHTPKLIIRNVATKNVDVLGIFRLRPGQQVDLFEVVGNNKTITEDTIMAGLAAPYGDLYLEVFVKNTLEIVTFDLPSFHYSVTNVTNLDTTNSASANKVLTATSATEFAWLDNVADTTKLQGESISSATPLEEDILVYTSDSWVPTQHKELDQLAHNLAENSYTEHTYSNGLVTNIITYADGGKSTKIREEQYTYNASNFISTIVTIQYDSDGVIKERLTDTYTYSNGSISSYTSAFEEL